MSWYHNRPNINWRNADWMTRVKDQGNTKLIDNYPGSGHVEWAFDYIKTNGIAYEDDYPWRGAPSEKKERTEDQEIYWGVLGFERVDVLTEIENVVEGHPVDIQPLFPVVTYDDGSTNQRGHTMVIVGQGNEEYDQYWHVKNSWGEGWGDEGYARMLKSDTTSESAFYPVYYPLIHEEY
nr:probable cysteine protease RDL6 [Ziziphus jujuba var. spinosa]